ncbi:hypothetical protein E4U56_006968 [Claviceps arundinis]|uniref:Uncharacterized protein n=1 Tax=Claviceps arundinis TaxID=1623583 RepID=A0A9P7MLT8_9HYPO|nr:hypothetical protein E4U56_006968 [Claviceps arundinis]
MHCSICISRIVHLHHDFSLPSFPRSDFLHLETGRIIDDLGSNKGESDQGEEEDEFWREQRRDLATATTEPFNDELINELQAASLTSAADTCALFTEQLQFTHKIPMYPSTHPEGYAYVVPAEYNFNFSEYTGRSRRHVLFLDPTFHVNGVDIVAKGFEYARRRGQNFQIIPGQTSH